MLPTIVVALLALSVYADERRHCHDLSCAPREELLAAIEHYRYTEKANRLEAADSNCTACYSQPCLNGGTCIPVGKTEYRCECFDNFGGINCEKNITCGDRSCGINANCFVNNHQINCICKKGYSGNPVTGCRMKTVQSCMSGDPHYKTFDGLYYDYQGTCPYIFSEPCGTLADGYSFYSVKAKNEFLNGKSIVSAVDEVEVVMGGITIHVDRKLNLLVNGVFQYYPFYYPNQKSYLVKVEKPNHRAVISNTEGVSVSFVYGELCVDVPDVPQFQGVNTLCGLAGNRDNQCLDDFRKRDGEIIPMPGIKNCRYGTGATAGVFGDTWLTKDFPVNPDGQACVDGQSVTNVTAKCDKQKVANECAAIYNAKEGKGPFKSCQPMGDDEIQSAYDDCIYDVCYGVDVCSALNLFVRNCQNQVPGADVSGWRSDPSSNCPYHCQPHSEYQYCNTGCPSTCSNPLAPITCPYPCSEGCSCDPGFVIDNTVSSSTKCIPLQDCGCSDINGNIHPPNQPWLSNSCMNINTCVNGTLVIQPYQCAVNADCGVTNGQYACVCNPGYTGDGQTCVDINECLDPTLCGQDTHQGNCTNTPGSYYCTCKMFYAGRDCEDYRPTRHCADFYVYHNQRTDGVYKITPPYNLSFTPPGSTVDVYCMMTVDGGGYTLMSGELDNLMANKTLGQYEVGFGSASTKQDQWLGLEIIHGMTVYSETSLRLDLHRCKSEDMPDTTSECTYDHFTVYGKDQGYAVKIPKSCHGSERRFTQWRDGWARWNLTDIGPVFSTMDEDHSPVSELATECGCSRSFKNTGWWFDTSSSSLCGSANLNGIRYQCGSEPADAQNYLFWGGAPIQGAKLWLRPFGYPNYDPQHPAPTSSQ